jgi:hypothetical protein
MVYVVRLSLHKYVYLCNKRRSRAVRPSESQKNTPVKYVYLSTLTGDCCVYVEPLMVSLWKAFSTLVIIIEYRPLLLGVG